MNEVKGIFMTTRWSLVLSAAEEDSPSLEVLCRQYWQPVYAVIRARGHATEEAQDLTQSFFAKLLEKKWLGSVDKEKGRFRTFLLTALKRFLSNEHERNQAAKRGGGHQIVALGTELGENLSSVEETLTPEQLFDRRWALTLLDAAMVRLKKETEEHFSILWDSLTATRGELNYQELARNLKLSEGAARVAVHRFRKRYKAVIRETVAETVATSEDIENELKILQDALS